MAVGRHMAKADLDNIAYQLYTQYNQLMDAALSAATLVAPFTAAQLAANTGYTVQEATDLISGINVLNTLRTLSRRNVAAAQVDTNEAATASQALVALGKFGGL